MQGMILGLQQSPLSRGAGTQAKTWGAEFPAGGDCYLAMVWAVVEVPTNDFHNIYISFKMGWYEMMISRDASLALISGEAFTKRNPTGQVSQGRGSKVISWQDRCEVIQVPQVTAVAAPARLFSNSWSLESWQMMSDVTV